MVTNSKPHSLLMSSNKSLSTSTTESTLSAAGAGLLNSQVDRYMPTKGNISCQLQPPLFQSSCKSLLSLSWQIRQRLPISLASIVAFAYMTGLCGPGTPVLTVFALCMHIMLKLLPETQWRLSSRLTLAARDLGSFLPALTFKVVQC